MQPVRVAILALALVLLVLVLAAHLPGWLLLILVILAILWVAA